MSYQDQLIFLIEAVLEFAQFVRITLCFLGILWLIERWKGPLVRPVSGQTPVTPVTRPDPPDR